MSEQWWIITDTNSRMRQVVTDGRAPGAAGEPMTGRTAYPMKRRGDFAIETPNLTDGTWTENLATLKDLLLDQIDAAREREQMKYLTTGGAKKMVYTQKAKEVVDFRALGSTAIAALNLEARRARFPAAMAEVDLNPSSTLAAVIAKYDAAATNANGKVLKIEALAQRAKEGVRAATTAAAARTAANVTWVV